MKLMNSGALGNEASLDLVCRYCERKLVLDIDSWMNSDVGLMSILISDMAMVVVSDVDGLSCE